MQRLNFRTILGAGLILLGGLMLLEQMNLLQGVSSLFWGLALFAGAAYFVMFLLQNVRSHWWAVFPAAALAGIGGATLLPQALSRWESTFFLGTMGAGFFVVYWLERNRWWAIIPGGVLLTLAALAPLNDVEGVSGQSTASLFLLGLGLTFLLVALLPTPQRQNQWAYFPAAALLLFGALLATEQTAGLVVYLWPAALIAAGVLVIVQFFRQRE
ncbi:MAG: hypothetical protein N2117_11080 [Anaerolineales bacterium]|nr:hypothetical protein [Anaerolineales bacterium]MCX7755769.1 hypothetical protein [Anaerolineales bacterium]MDW8279027.1 hypothetical protein [Anaerolineales bacterium]